ncbi:hypothetical protein ASAP_3191 [Asaia bogorensis]|uniref:Uncharacterized protein n=1 Tax=Asaia bogorensis TaxID=91915 RepID=A0A060QM22_9PROT|nr:hypothetical protein ASAP_3191 [Asaia bogorensis]
MWRAAQFEKSMVELRLSFATQLAIDITVHTITKASIGVFTCLN